MLMMSMLIMSMMLLAGVIHLGFRLAWGTTKFLFGLGLFWFCPVLFIVAVLLGGFHYVWLPIVIVGLVMGRGWRRI